MTPHQAFVEAMRGLICAGGTDAHRGHCIICVRAHGACKAFADAECGATSDGRGTHGRCYDELVYHPDRQDEIVAARKRHATCVADICREVGL